MVHVDLPQADCQGAVARRDVTPPAGIYHRMWGAATHERATGVHRPLTATALALAPHPDAAHGDRAAAQVIVAVDHCLLWTDEMNALRAAVARAAGVPVENLQVALTHTHAAGLMDRARGDLPGGELIGPYLDRLTGQISEAACEALDALQPVRVVYGCGHSSLAAHRDFWDEERRLYVCGYNPGGPTDDTVLVARMSDARGQTLGTLVNYACHPTTLAWENTLISPDYVGAMRALVEQVTAAPCVFLQGASADLGPRHGYVDDTAVADRNGRELGYAALAALERLGSPGTHFEYTGPVVSGATLGTWTERPLGQNELAQKRHFRTLPFTVQLERRADLPDRQETEDQLAHWQREQQAAAARGDAAAARDCRAQIERTTRQLARLSGLGPGSSVPAAVAIWRLGDAFWVFVAGEYYNVLQRTLRARLPGHPVIVSTITNGWLPGYVPTAETYGKGIYQESIAIAAPGSLERLIDELLSRMATLG